MKHSFPSLYARNKKGDWKIWTIEVIDHIVITIHGLYGGNLIREERHIETLKRPHTNLHDQAKSFALSKWNHKRDRESYRETMTDTTVIARPMLAKTFDAGKHLHFPLFVQPKIDGLRCIAFLEKEEVRLYSRTGMEFRSSCLINIRKQLENYFKTYPNVTLDGELYSKDIPFEELSGLCRAESSGTNSDITYYIFDTIVPDIEFYKRIQDFPSPSTHIFIVPTTIVENLSQIESFLDDFISQGYEGIMIRNRDGKYQQGHRSWDLQKWKRFEEEEFTITGFTEGSGREKGAVVWECQTQDGKPFRVRPDGDMSTRRKIFQEAHQYIGKQLTVCFQEWTKDGVPRFPVAKSVREGF